jgi:cytochrome bd-type quinol oxidase subunit 1
MQARQRVFMRNRFTLLCKETRVRADMNKISPRVFNVQNRVDLTYSRFSRHAALALVLGGYLLLILYSVYEFLQSKDAAAIPKIAVAAIVIGFIMLLLGLIRERIATYKSDPYKGVKR